MKTLMWEDEAEFLYLLLLRKFSHNLKADFYNYPFGV